MIIGTHLHLASDVGSILHRPMLVFLAMGLPNPCRGHRVNQLSLKVVHTEGLGVHVRGEEQQVINL